METKRKMRIAGILLGLVAALCLALCLAPGLAIAEDTSSGTVGGELQTAESGKPSQAIQAAYLPSFTTDTGKNLNAKVVEGNGALSYAVKSGGDCVSVDSNGALTFSKAGKAIITVTAAATNEYAETSIDVPITIYDHFDYTFTVGNTLDCVDYYGHYPINKLDIKLKGWENELGSGTIINPKPGSKTTISATGFAKRIELKAEIQYRRTPRTASETLSLNGGGRFEIEVTSRGTIVMCDYGITLPEPDYVAPVAKPNLSSNGQNQLLIYPGSVLSDGQHMEYTFGTATEPNQNGWTDNYGLMRAKDPGDYYVWWKTASRDRRSLMYFSGGRLDTAPQCMKVTIGKGNINPTVSIDGWIYGEDPKAPTVTGNTGNGAVTYEYKVKGADNVTYTTEVPTDAGDYTVRATIDETTTHSGGTATADFTIAKADVSNQNVRVVGVMGSRDTEQAWVGNFTKSLQGMVPTDAGTVTYAAGTPTYKDGAIEAPEGVRFTSEVSTDGEFSATLTIDKEATAIPEGAQEITVPVTVTCEKNYKSSTINIVLVPKERTLVTVSLPAPPESVAYGDRDFTLTATVKDGGDEAVTTRDGNWYWYSSDPNVLEVANTGSNEMPIKVKSPGSAQIMAWYEPSDENTIGAALTKPITVDKGGITPSVTLAGWTYGSEPNAPSVSGNPGNGEVSYEYKAEGAADSTYTATVPTLAGKYTVRATVPETDNYKGDTCTANFTIDKKEITATVIALDKTYDGTTDATAIATVEKSDLVESDIDSAALVEDGKVAISGVTCTFKDKNVGENKEVVLNYDNVTSPVANAECYEVAIAATPTAAITPRPVNIEADNKSSRHGAALAELTYGLRDSTTLAEGDDLASLGITATTTASSSSDEGDYPITLTGGTANPNYKVTLVGGATYTITKGQGLTKSIRVVGVLSSDDAAGAWVASIEQPLAGMMPNDAGTLTYAAGTDTMPAGIESYNVDASSGKVTARLRIQLTDTYEIPTEMRQITLPVTVASSKNYENSTINVIVVPTKRTEKQVTIEGAPASKTYGDADFTLTATVNDDQAAGGDWYWYSSDPSVLEVPAITNPNTGSNTVNVKVHNPGSAMILAWYEPSDPNRQYIGAALTEPITVNKMSISPSVSIEGWTYGEAPKPPSLAEDSNPGGCTVTYEYKAKGADDGAYSEDIPTEAGAYTVRATVPESTYHEGDTCTADFTITKKPVTATVTAEDKVYDGTTSANVSVTVSEGVFEEDVVTVSGLKGAFDDAKAGEGKAVAVDRTGATFTGEGSANYEVAIPETTTATIGKRPVSVKADDKTSQYGEDIAALTYGLDGSTTLAEGDTLASLGVTASTAAVKGSDVGAYPIKLSGDMANPNYNVTLGKDGTYTIAAADISAAKVELAQTSFVYDGSAKEPAMTSVTLGGKTLAAGTDYDVSYKDNVEAGTATVTVTGKGNYAGVATATFTIERPTYSNVEGGGASWTKGSATGLTFTFKRSVDDDKTFSHFTGIQVDGADVPEGSYDAVPGSVVVTLKPAFLKTLAPGEHTLTALFDDADPAEAKFTVSAAAAPQASGSGSAGTPASFSTPRTSASGTALARTADPLRPEVPAALALAAAAGVAAGLRTRRRAR